MSSSGDGRHVAPSRFFTAHVLPVAAGVCFSATVFCFFLTSVFDPVVRVNVSFSPNHMDTLINL
jgi:hypothetical protein